MSKAANVIHVKEQGNTALLTVLKIDVVMHVFTEKKDASVFLKNTAQPVQLKKANAETV